MIEVKCQYKEMVDPSTLVPHPRNPNKHPAHQIGLLSKLIKHQGWRHPIIVSKQSGFIVAGHGRLESALKLKAELVPVDYQDFENEAQEYQFMASDNAIQELAELDFAMVKNDVLDFGPDFDLEMLGIPDFELDAKKTNESLDSNEDESQQFILAVTLKNETQLQSLYEECLERGFSCRIID